MFNNIPVRILAGNNDLVSPFITNVHNDSISNLDYPARIKVTDITTVCRKTIIDKLVFFL